jgi:hypothetical protein
MKGRLHQMSRVAGQAETGRRDGWHLMRDGAVVVLARRLPARFDLSASIALPVAGHSVGRARLARQVRQDVWRCLRDLRGFWPVVRIEQGENALHVTAGGALSQGPLSAGLRKQVEQRLADLLADPARHRRWLTYAGRAA